MNIANILNGQGEAEEAREHHRKAVAVREAAEPLQALVEAVSAWNACMVLG